MNDAHEYSETFLDHYRRPRNLGDLEQADAVAIVHDHTCGDLLRLAIGLEDPEDLVADLERSLEAL